MAYGMTCDTITTIYKTCFFIWYCAQIHPVTVFLPSGDRHIAHRVGQDHVKQHCEDGIKRELGEALGLPFRMQWCGAV